MDFNARLQAFVESAKAKAANGLTIAEMTAIVYEFIQLATAAANELSNPGAEKKALVLDWAGKLFDVLIVFVPLPMWYRLAVAPFARKYVRAAYLEVVSALIEFLRPKG
jgi:hypothetical protein